MPTPVKPDTAVTAAQTLWESAARFADRPCVTDLDAPGGPRTLSYAQLAETVSRIAGGLTALGARPGDRVALLVPGSIAYVASFLAASAAGLISVPLNVRLLGSDYHHMLADSGSKVLVTTAEFIERVPELTSRPGLTVVVVDGGSSCGHSLDELGGEPLRHPLARDPEAPASLMYTSGTTGLPKAVVLSNRAWAVIADRAISVLRMADDEVTLHAAPLTHGAGFLLLPTLMLGGHNVVIKSFAGGRALDILRDHGITGTFLVPSMIRMLLDAAPAGWRAPATLRRVYYAGSPIDPATFREATRAFDGRLVQSFAQMESPMFFTVLDPGGHVRAVSDASSPLLRSAGQVLPGVELRIIGDDGNEAAPGQPGEILARAPQTMNGYWNRPEATAHALADGWLHTGDVGYLDEAGYLYIVDRKKDMIVTGGANVYAREVEEVLLELPEVRDAAVIGTPHRVWGEAVTAVLVPAGEDRDAGAVIAACRAKLAGYRVPKRVEWVESLPRNAYGKVLKQQLRERFSVGA
jgi:acyl-CoA synthetase (AMP-forming)/AMP-acid ligase II